MSSHDQPGAQPGSANALSSPINWPAIRRTPARRELLGPVVQHRPPLGMPRVDRRVAVRRHHQVAVDGAVRPTSPGGVDASGVAVVPAKPLGRDGGGDQLLVRGGDLQPVGVERVEGVAALQRLDDHRPLRVIDGAVAEDRLQIAPQLLDRLRGRRASVAAVRAARTGQDPAAGANALRLSGLGLRTRPARRSSPQQRTIVRRRRLTSSRPPCQESWASRAASAASPPCRTPSSRRASTACRPSPTPASPSRAAYALSPTCPNRTRSNLPSS